MWAELGSVVLTETTLSALNWVCLAGGYRERWTLEDPSSLGRKVKTGGQRSSSNVKGWREKSAGCS